jgi:SAM-dependent methyltransferase
MVSLDPRRLLSSPRAYRAFDYVISSQRWRSWYPNEMLRAAPNDRVLDIGCGTAEILNDLPRVEYHGFDMSPVYIESARRRLGERGTFYCRRVGRDTFDDLGQFDLVMATGILHHLTDDEALELFELARKVLSPGGRLVTCDGCYVPRQNQIARLVLASDRGKHVRDEAGYVRLAGRVFERVEATIRDDLLRIPYTHIFLQCTH